MYCPHCGAVNSDGASFCYACGAPLGGAAAPDPVPTAAPVRGNAGRWVLLILSLLVIAGGVALLLFVILPRQNAARQPAVPAVAATAPSPDPASQPVIVESPASPLPTMTSIVTPGPASPEPTPAPATPVPATPEPTAAPGTGGTVTLDANTQYRVNIFLSNFSEQSIKPFHTATVADDYLLRFVEVYCKINHPGLVGYEGAYETLSLEDMNAFLLRFFNRSVSPVEGQEFLLDAWNSFRYSGGKFYFPAASGESYNKFTIVYEMTRRSDGTYDASFQVFELKLEEYWNYPGVDNAFYWLNNDEVAQYVWDERVTPVQGGTAHLQDYTYNGRQTYQILDYDVWDILF